MKFFSESLLEDCAWKFTELVGEDQISALVHFASVHRLKVRAVGTGASWSKITKAQDILIG